MMRALLISTALLQAAPLCAGDVTDMVDLEVLPGWRQADGTHLAAVRLQLAPGWKTFWRAPGDAGIPARFDVDDSVNLSGIEPVWPTPQVFNISGMRSIGYVREVVLPLRIVPNDTSEPVRLKGEMDLGICSDVCVPASLRFDAVLPPEGEADLRIQTALIDVPYSAEDAGVSDIFCAVGPVQYGMGFRSEITLPAMGGDETVVVETGDPMIWVAESRSWWEGDVLVTETEMSHLERAGLTIDPQDIRITVIGKGQAVEINGCPKG